MDPGIDDAVLADIVARISDPVEYARFASQVARSGGCSCPARLQGFVTGLGPGGKPELLYSTSSEPDGFFMKACNNRRATLCPSCAAIYKADARHIIAPGLIGGKGVPESVGQHPRLFATFTAPSFGAVHSRRARGHDASQVCRPGTAGICAHGRPMKCLELHGEGDPHRGEPLCADCFDYEGAILWNAHATELWRRTVIYMPRVLAELAGTTFTRFRSQARLEYARVAEPQLRGSYHVHALIRLDGIS